MDKLIIINQNNTFITSTPLLVPVQARAIVTLTHTLVSLTPIPPSLSEQSNQILHQSNQPVYAHRPAAVLSMFIIFQRQVIEDIKSIQLNGLHEVILRCIIFKDFQVDTLFGPERNSCLYITRNVFLSP